MKQFDIYITARQGIFDPAGATAKNALENLGFEGIGDVKIGKFIQLTVDDTTSHETIEKMCERLLANPIIEDFRIESST